MKFLYSVQLLLLIFTLTFHQFGFSQTADFSFSQEDVDSGSAKNVFQGPTSSGSGTPKSLTQTYSMTVFTDQVGDPGKEPIREYFEEKLNVKLDGSGRPGEQNVIINDYPNILVSFNGNYVLMTISDQPMEFTAEQRKWLYSDPRVQEKLDGHPSYVHVEMIQMRYSMDERDAFRILSVFAAGLVNPQQTRAIASFSLEKVVLFDPSHIHILNGDNPRELFFLNTKSGHSGSQSSQTRRNQQPQPSGNSSRISLEEARKRTHDSFDSFKRSYSSRPLISSYQVLSLQSESDRSELVWLEVEFFSGNDVEGKVIQNPKTLLELKKDDVIRVEHDTLMNWKIISPEGNDQAIDPIIAIPSGLQ